MRSIRLEPFGEDTVSAYPGHRRMSWRRSGMSLLALFLVAVTAALGDVARAQHDEHQDHLDLPDVGLVYDLRLDFQF